MESQMMTKLLALAAFGCLLAHAVFADAVCEKKLAATKMIVLPGDPKIVCDRKPTAATQDCMVELLGKGKGKLRNPDFFEIYGVCRTNPSRRMRDCVTKRMSKAWNAPDYQSIHIIGDQCRFELAGVKVKKFPTYKELVREDKERLDRDHPGGRLERTPNPPRRAAPTPAPVVPAKTQD